MCAQHGAALFSLACALLDDRDAAERAVVHVLADACARPGLPDRADGTDSAGGQDVVRRQLAGQMYRHCTEPDARLPAPVDNRLALRSAGAIIAGLTALSKQQRAAIALVLFGEHGYRDVSRLLHLPAPKVASLLRTGLQELRP